MRSRLLGWAALGLVAATLIRVVHVGMDPITNADTWFHLRTGQELGDPWEWGSVQHWSSFATADWVPTQALSDQAMWFVESAGGLDAVALVYAASLAVLVIVLFVVCRAHGSRLAASFATATAVLAASSSLSPRPQVLSLILLPVVVHLWLRSTEDLRPRWQLVPLTWLWALLHGFWIFGVAIGVLCTAAVLVGGRATRRQALNLMAVSLASGLVVLMTPIGPRLALAALTVNDRTQFITEWQRTSFSTADPWPAVAMVLLAGALLVATRRLTTASGLLLAMAMFLIAYATRTVDVGAVIAAPILTGALSAIVTSDAHADRRRERIFLGTVAVISLATVAIMAGPRVDRPGSNFPNDLDPALDALPRGTTVFDSTALGGWLAWRHPDLNVVIDGLFDAYPVHHIRDVRDASLGRPGWEQFMDRTSSNAALIDEGGALESLLRSAGWAEVGQDAGYVLLVRPRS